MLDQPCPDCGAKMTYREGELGECIFCPKCGYNRMVGDFQFVCPTCNKTVECRTVIPEDISKNGAKLSIGLEVMILNEHDHENCFIELEEEEKNYLT